MPVRRVIYAVICRHPINTLKVEGIYAFKAAHVKAVLFGVGAALMVGIDAAIGTKEMLCGLCIELIELQYAVTLDNFYAR